MFCPEDSLTLRALSRSHRPRQLVNLIEIDLHDVDVFGRQLCNVDIKESTGIIALLTACMARLDMSSAHGVYRGFLCEIVEGTNVSHLEVDDYVLSAIGVAPSRNSIEQFFDIH